MPLKLSKIRNNETERHKYIALPYQIRSDLPHVSQHLRPLHQFLQIVQQKGFFFHSLATASKRVHNYIYRKFWKIDHGRNTCMHMLLSTLKYRMTEFAVNQFASLGWIHNTYLIGNKCNGISPIKYFIGCIHVFLDLSPLFLSISYIFLKYIQILSK